MNVVLENTSRQPITLVLPHELVCSEDRCICSRQKVVQFDHNPETGDQSARAKSVRLPHSVQLFPAGRDGSKSEPLPHVAARAPDVVKQLRANAIRVINVAEPAPPPAPAPQGDGPSTTETPVVEASEEHQPDPGDEPAPPPEPTLAPVVERASRKKER